MTEEERKEQWEDRKNNAALVYDILVRISLPVLGFLAMAMWNGQDDLKADYSELDKRVSVVESNRFTNAEGTALKLQVQELHTIAGHTKETLVQIRDELTRFRETIEKKQD